MHKKNQPVRFVPQSMPISMNNSLAQHKFDENSQNNKQESKPEAAELISPGSKLAGPVFPLPSPGMLKYNYFTKARPGSALSLKTASQQIL